MSKVDDELSRRFKRAERPLDDADLFEGVARRRRRRRTLQRLEAGALAAAVLAGTVGGFLALQAAFREEEERDVVQAPLPSNGSIVFVRDGKDGHSHLFTMRPDGTGVRQLTDFVTNDSAPAVSPDGRTVAFRHELEDLSPVIATIPIEGGEVTWLTDERLFVTGQPSWSPDGSRLAFAAHDGEGQRLFVMNADGSDVHPITEVDLYWVTDGRWSPDGTRIALTASLRDGAGEPSTFDIFTVRADGSDLVNVTRTPSAGDDEFGPDWSPDGARLVFSRDDGPGSVLVLRDLADRTETILTEGHVDDGPAWSPDGTVIAFNRATTDRGGFDLWVVRPDGTGLVRLTDDGGFNPSWQPIAASSDASTTTSPEPSIDPSPEPEGKDVGLRFNLCDTERLGGIDFLGDGTDGTAWTGKRVRPDGTCPNRYDDRYGVAADTDGDGLAESWSGETIVSCGGCEPLRAMDLNGDGGEELLIVLDYFSIMHYGVYTIVPIDGVPHVRTFRTGPPGHPGHPDFGLEGGAAFDLWVGGDAGSANWVYCETLPELWLTATQSPIDPGPGDVTTVYETHVSLGTDGIAHILSHETYSVPAEVQPQLRYAGPDHSQPDCGLGVNGPRP